MKAWERIVFSLFALAILAAIGIKLHELDMPVARFVRSFSIAEVNYSGDLMAFFGKGIVLAGVFLLIGLLGWGLTRDRLKELGIRGLVAMAGVGAVSQLLKHLIGRPRPRFAHADEFFLGPSLASGMDSFPSGHAINAFGAATVVAWFVPLLRVPLFLIAGLVGLSRIVRGSHFPTDVFAGAMLGVLIGSLAAAGFKRWRDEALPGLLRTGVPLTVSVFLIAWVVLHPMPPWSQEIRYIGMGVALVLAGGLLRRLSVAYQGKESGLLRTAGHLVLILGVAVACGPWWGGLVLTVALIPITLAWLRHPLPHPPPSWPIASGGAMGAPEGKGGGAYAVWGRETLAVGVALTAIAVIRSVKGLLPLG